MILGSPVYYAGPCGQLCPFLDRLFYLSRGAWQGKLGASISSPRRAGGPATFDRLNKYFTISQMSVVSSQYWSEVHGNAPEEVERDEEGLQTMRTLARNFACLLKVQKVAQRDGIVRPKPESHLWTNSIR